MVSHLLLTDGSLFLILGLQISTDGKSQSNNATNISNNIQSVHIGYLLRNQIPARLRYFAFLSALAGSQATVFLPCAAEQEMPYGQRRMNSTRTVGFARILYIWRKVMSRRPKKPKRKGTSQQTNADLSLIFFVFQYGIGVPSSMMPMPLTRRLMMENLAL